jgi:ATP-dependent RNA helicase RhlE
MSFENLGLRPEILTGVKFQGYIEPTPIQRQAIPVILQGRDILAGAQTGTGKTAAFTLPLLHILSTQGHRGGHRPRALILTPTRELAAQVGKSVETYGQGLHIRSTIIFGGVGINPQIKELRRGVHIVIGTPGRLLDLAGQKVLDLSCIEVLILDEADRMLDMGFIHDIRKIIRMVPKKRQTLFFSATYSKEIKALADTILHKPKLVEVASQNVAAETVEQSVYLVPKSRKCELLTHLIKEGDWNQVLVFTRTKHGANRLAKQLGKNGIMAAAIHGNKSQSARTLALAEFKACKVRVLVATDIASRGLDIDRLPHVVNYEMPNISEDYVHRIGRTGRAGSTGEAISLVMDEEVKLLRAIERLIKKTIPVNRIEGFSKPAKVPEEDETAGVEAHRHRRRGGNKGSFRSGKPHVSKGNSGGAERGRAPKR